MTELIGRPAFTGLVVHYDPRHDFSFLIPDGWVPRELSTEGSGGVFYSPSLDEPFTGFAADGRNLEVTVTAADLEDLHAGFLSGLRRLPRSVIESQEAEAIGDLITLEARHTYREGKETRKRWVRLLYRGTTQVRLVAQGATVAAFHYWLPMFFESMRTVRFGDWRTEVRGPVE